MKVIIVNNSSISDSHSINRTKNTNNFINITNLILNKPNLLSLTDLIVNSSFLDNNIDQFNFEYFWTVEHFTNDFQYFNERK